MTSFHSWHLEALRLHSAKTTPHLSVPSHSGSIFLTFSRFLSVHLSSRHTDTPTLCCSLVIQWIHVVERWSEITPPPFLSTLSPVQRLEVTEQGCGCRHGIWKYEQRGGAEPEGVWAVRAETQHSTAAEGLHCPAVHLQARQAHGLPQGVLREAGEGMCVCLCVCVLFGCPSWSVDRKQIIIQWKLIIIYSYIAPGCYKPANMCHHKLYLFTLGQTIFPFISQAKPPTSDEANSQSFSLKHFVFLWCYY